MKKNLMLHIGFGKTGTSSIQKMLFDNRGILQESGWYYPDAGIHQHAHHHFAAFDLDDLGKCQIKLISDVIEKFDESNNHTLILSSEQFSFCRKNYIKQLSEYFNGWDVTIIFYIRNQVDLIASAYMQKVSDNRYQAYNNDLLTFFKINKNAFDYNVRIEPWKSFFSNSNVIVRIYDRNYMNDVCEDFLLATGINNIKLAESDDNFQQNYSLSPDFLNLIYLVDTLNLTASDREKIIFELEKLSPSLEGYKSKKFLTDKIINQINTYYINRNKEFAKKYLNNKQQEIFLS